MLQDLIEKTYRLLKEAPHNPRLDFHWPVLSVDDSARMVVLRELLRNPLSWQFYTDKRSPKVYRLKKNGGTCVALFYDRQERLQLRVKGEAKEMCEKHFREKIWDGLSVLSKRNYATELAPGTELEYPEKALSTSWASSNPTEEEDAMAFNNLLVYEVKITEIDALDLSSLTHERAIWSPGAEAEGRWVVP